MMPQLQFNNRVALSSCIRPLLIGMTFVPSFAQINKKEKKLKKNALRVMNVMQTKVYEDDIHNESGLLNNICDYVEIDDRLPEKNDPSSDIVNAAVGNKTLQGSEDILKRTFSVGSEAKEAGKKVVYNSEHQPRSYDDFKKSYDAKNYKSEVSYAWVNNLAEANVDFPLPATNQDHGLMNVINNAKVTPNVIHVIYVDRRTAGIITSPVSVMPDNVVIAPAKFLFNRFDETIDGANIRSKLTALKLRQKIPLLGNKLDIAHQIKEYEFVLGASHKMQELYQAELMYGKPAFAKNILSLMAISNGGYFFDIGVKVIPGKRLWEKLISGGSGPVMRGSYILGAYDRKQVSSIMYELYNRYTGNVGSLEKPAFNPNKAVKLLRELFEHTPSPTVADVNPILNGKVAKYYEPMSPREFVENSVEISRLLHENHIVITSDNARLNDSVFGNTLGAFQPRDPYRLDSDLDFSLSHQRSHLPAARTERKDSATGQNTTVGRYSVDAGQNTNSKRIEVGHHSPKEIKDIHLGSLTTGNTNDFPAELLGCVPAAPRSDQQYSTSKMHSVLADEMFSTKIDSVDVITENDILIRTANIRQSSTTKRHNDLQVHSSILMVKRVSEETCTFIRLEMVEAGVAGGLVGYNDRYLMGLDFSQQEDTKPNDFFKHGDTYKIHIPSTGKILRSSKVNTYKLFANALRSEGRMLKNTPPTYGSELDGLYNCNTFVANVLLRAVGLSNPTQLDNS